MADKSKPKNGVKTTKYSYKTNEGGRVKVKSASKDGVTISKETVRSGGLLSKRTRTVSRSLDSKAAQKIEQKKEMMKQRLAANRKSPKRPTPSRESYRSVPQGIGTEKEMPRKPKIVKRQTVETPGALNQARTYRGLKKQL
jgi:hypothetical protein